MLQVIAALKGFAMEATDGRIGTVAEFLFDDATWKVRWLVVESGTWLKGRKLLVHPPAVTYAGLEDQRFDVKLTNAQVESSPTLQEHQPVSQQMQDRVYDHYGWEPTWDGVYPGDVVCAMASPMMAPAYFGLGIDSERNSDIVDEPDGDPHRRSVVEVIGYHIQALDGDIGHVENVLVDNEDWSLQYFVVDTSDWWCGKRVLIAMQAVKGVEWPAWHIHLDLSREQVRTSRVWDPLVAFDELEKTLPRERHGWAGSGLPL